MIDHCYFELKIFCTTHSPKLRPGGLIPEMILVCDYYILKVLDELLTLIYVRPLNVWQHPKLRHFEVENCGPKMTLFSGSNVDFLVKRKLRPQTIAC